MRKPLTIPPELQAQVDYQRQVLTAFHEAIMTAVLTAAYDTNVDADFAIDLAAEWLREEDEKRPRCQWCDSRKKRCIGCKRKMACQCSETPNLCKTCETTVNNAVKHGMVQL